MNDIDDGILGFGSILDFDEKGDAGVGLLDDLFPSVHTCTHRHFCNPPGPDNTHTHSCSHTHTHLVATPELSGSAVEKRLSEKEGEAAVGTAVTGKKRQLGNREAVRKYRERKKAHIAQLEEELAEQKELNQQLMRRLQAQTALEAEVVRLRALLSGIRSNIDKEVNSSRKPVAGLDGRGDSISTMRLIPIHGEPSQLVGSQFFLQAVDLPCEPLLPCMKESSRTLRSHPGTPPWPACDVGQACMVGANKHVEGLNGEPALCGDAPTSPASFPL